MRALEKNTWWPALVADKDSLSLRQLGEKYKCTPGAITNALKRTGLTRQSAPSGPRLKQEAELPPMVESVQPSENHETTKSTVNAKAKSAVPSINVAKKRGRKSKITPYKEFVGNLPDSEVAEMAGVTIFAIRAYRSKHAIKLTAKSRKRPGRPRKQNVSASVKAPAATPVKTVLEQKNTDSISVYAATFKTSEGDVVRYVSGASLSAAADYATKRGAECVGGELVSIVFVGISI